MKFISWLLALTIIYLACACSAVEIVEYSGNGYEDTSDTSKSTKSISDDSSKSSQAKISENSQKPEDLESGDYQEPDSVREKLGSGEKGLSREKPGIGSGLETSNQNLGSGNTADGDLDQESGDSQEPDLESGSGDEDGDDESELKSKSKSKSKQKIIFKHYLAWIKHSRNGSTIHATAEDVQTLFDFMNPSHASHDCFISKGKGESSYDGPLFPITVHTNQKQSSPPLPESRQHVNNVKDYPGFAVGRLDNGCTAFLIGPYHALTLAHCVLNRHNLQWKGNNNLFIGRKYEGYLQAMEWESVYIPQVYFHRGRLVNRGRSWALIVFTKDKPSPVWLPISYCPGKAFSSADKVRAFGYHHYCPWCRRDYIYDNNDMSYIDCSIYGHLSCPLQHEFIGYFGGPVVIKSSHLSYDIKHMKTAPVVGINGRRNSCYGAQAVSFNSEIFWSIAYLLRESGHNPVCEKWEANKKD